MLHPALGEEHSSCDHVQHRNPFTPPRGSSRPINTFPIELLSRIFRIGTEDSLHRGVRDLVIICALGADDDCATGDGVNTEKEHFTDGIERIGQSSSTSDAYPLHPFEVVVSHVCQRWRDVAISTASLWTSITIYPILRYPYQRIATLLERSKCLPIDIRVHFRSREHGVHSGIEATPSMADLKLLYSLLVAHTHRWRSIEARAASNEQMYAFFNATSGPTITAPQLISLVLSTNQPRDHDNIFRSLIIAKSFTLFGGSAPCLQTVFLWRVPIDWNQDWMSFASRLTRLELLGHSDDETPSWEEFTAILRGAPALEHLVLHGSGPHGDPPNLDTDPNQEIVSPDPNTPIQLLKPKHLSLLLQSRTCVYAILRTLYMPALKSLWIDFFWDDYTEFLSYITAPAPIPATLSIEQRPKSLLYSLETLNITCLFCTTEVIEILYDELENVKSLKISFDDFWYAPEGCTLILPLFPTTVGHGVVNMRLPRLEKLTISDVSSDPHLQVIRKVVQQRNDVGVPIKSLYIEGTCDLDGEDMVWFEENMETFVFSRQHANE